MAVLSWAFGQSFKILVLKYLKGMRKLFYVESMIMPNLAGIMGKQKRFMILKGKFFLVIPVLLNCRSSGQRRPPAR